MWRECDSVVQQVSLKPNTSFRLKHLPLIDLMEYVFRLSWAMLFLDILLNPSNQVVFEGPFYCLMEKVRGK